MKYSLIIGYQLFEKYKNFPIIRVNINGSLIDEFTCDNEESTQLDLYDEKYVEINGTSGYGFKQLRLFKSQYLAPKKYTVIEIDTASWGDHNVLNIEVMNNPSNNTNGFITKRSIVSLNPVFFIKTDLLNDKKTMQRIMSYDLMAKDHPDLLRRRGKDRLGRWRWPGVSIYNLTMDSNGITWRSQDSEHNTKGGDFSVGFNIIKKHRTFILQQTNTVKDTHIDQGNRNLPNNIIGIFRIEPFFRAWYQKYTRNKFISRFTATFDRDHDSVKDMECCPAHLDTGIAELDGENHVIVRSVKNK